MQLSLLVIDSDSFAIASGGSKMMDGLMQVHQNERVIVQRRRC